jgi:3-methyladenine DNA glycosylase/8-oxoguanine DNA glycosylase
VLDRSCGAPAGRRSIVSCAPREGSSTEARPPWDALCNATRILAAGRSLSEARTSLNVTSRTLDALFGRYLGTSPRRLAEFLEGAQFPSGIRPPVRRADLELEVPYEPPLDLSASLALLADRAAPGVESIDEHSYRRTFAQTGAQGRLIVTAGTRRHLSISVRMDDWSGLAHVVRRARQLFNLDADGGAADRVLSRDFVIGHLVRVRPGVRPPGCWDLFEAATKAFLACSWDVRGEEWLRRLVEKAARRTGLEDTHRLTRLFPLPEDIARMRPNDLGLPFFKAVAVHGIAQAAVDGSGVVDPLRPLHERIHELTSLTGVGPVTGSRYAWILGHPDAYPEKAGAPLPGVDAGHRKRAAHVADRWRPYRSFAYAQLAVSASAGHQEEELHMPERWSRRGGTARSEHQTKARMTPRLTERSTG